MEEESWNVATSTVKRPEPLPKLFSESGLQG